MAPVTRGFRIALIAGLISMGALSGARPVLAQQSATAPTLDRWQGFVAEASQRFGLPPAWIRAVMRAESGGNPRALSPKGATGLMQIMPATWGELRARYDLGPDPYEPRDNILAGTAYLRELYDRYGYPNLFAAYNAGPQRFDAHRFNGKPLPDETLAYLARLGQPTFEPPSAPVVASGTSLFFPLRTAGGSLPNPLTSILSDSLFVPLKTVLDRKP
jgi:soluble lytic murein transglycosylase-like protein